MYAASAAPPPTVPFAACVVVQADGGTTSDTGKNSWGASSDRSELENSRATSVATTATTRLSSGAMAGPDGDEALTGSSDMGAGEVDGRAGRRKRRGEGEGRSGGTCCLCRA